jgi:hypothetical protein
MASRFWMAKSGGQLGISDSYTVRSDLDKKLRFPQPEDDPHRLNSKS